MSLRLLDHDRDVELVREKRVLVRLSLRFGLVEDLVRCERFASRCRCVVSVLGRLGGLDGVVPHAAGPARVRRVGDRSEGDRDVQQVDVAQAGHLEAPGEGPIVDGCQEKLEHAGEVGIIDKFARR